MTFNQYLICPHCESDEIKQEEMSFTNLTSYPPMICKAGFNFNLDRNRSTTSYICISYGKSFTINTILEFKNPCINCLLICKDRIKSEDK